MGLRNKVSITFFFAILTMLLITYSITTVVTMKSYTKFDNEFVEKETRKVEKEAMLILSKNDSMVNDWATWDQMLGFINGNNDQLIEENVVPLFFADQEVNYVLIYDKDGNLIFSEGYDFIHEGYIKVPKHLGDIMYEYKNEHGVIKLCDKLYSYTSKQITDSNGTSEPEGLLVFATMLEEKVLENLTEEIDYDIVLNEVTSMKDEHIKADFTTEVNLYSPITNNSEYLELSFTINNDIKRIGVNSVHHLVAFYTVFTLIIGVVIYLIVLKFIRRMEYTSKKISNIKNHYNTDIRLETKGNDELSKFSSIINHMLDEIADKNKKIIEHATMDMLTGVFNRRVGIEKLDKFIKDAKKFEHDLVICFVDVNNLKYVNDTYGHKAGDEYLITVVDVIKKSIRGKDLVFRLGGDEFLVVFRNCKKENARRVISRVNKDLDVLNKTDEYEYDMSISKGIVAYDFEMDVSEFIELADKKMYIDKKKNHKKMRCNDEK